MKVKNLKLVPQQEEDFRMFTRDKEYIRANMNYFIAKEADYNRYHLAGQGWTVEVDDTTKMRKIVLDYILAHFSTQDLFLVFFWYLDYFLLYEGKISEVKRLVIENINTNKAFSQHKAKVLKEKVRNTPDLTFELITKLVYESDIFWDEENKEVVFPNIDINEFDNDQFY